MNNTFSLVLGYPYWNAFYWLLTAEGWRKEKLRVVPKGTTHTYYNNLYNFIDLSILDEVASICLLYDEIYFSPADSWLPDQNKYYKDSNYRNTSLGFYSSWNWRDLYFNDRDLIRKILREINPAIIPQNLIYSIDNAELIIIDILTQIHLAVEFNCSLLIGKQYENLYYFLSRFIDKEVVNDYISKGLIVKTGSESIKNITGFLFQLNSFEEFLELRRNTKIKEYGSCFRESLLDTFNEKFDESQFLETLMHIINTSSLSNKIGAGLNVSSKLLSIASLFPVVGTVTGIGGLTTDYLGNSMIKNPKNQWWALYPEIEKALTKYRIEKKYNESHKKDLTR
jgi:hypothetical protein